MRARTPLLAAFLVLVFALAAACGGGDDGASPPEDATSSGEGSTVAEAGPAFATGPAVVIPAGYVPPDDRVDATGAYLPVNGKPTLVYVDAIW